MKRKDTSASNEAILQQALIEGDEFECIGDSCNFQEYLIDPLDLLTDGDS